MAKFLETKTKELKSADPAYRLIEIRVPIERSEDSEQYLKATMNVEFIKYYSGKYMVFIVKLRATTQELANSFYKDFPRFALMEN